MTALWFAFRLTFLFTETHWINWSKNCGSLPMHTSPNARSMYPLSRNSPVCRASTLFHCWSILTELVSRFAGRIVESFSGQTFRPRHISEITRDRASIGLALVSTKALPCRQQIHIDPRLFL